MNDLSPDSFHQASEDPYAAYAPPVPTATVVDCNSPVLPGSRCLIATICGLLCLAVVLVFCQTGGYDFVNYDDDHYVYENEHINCGLTWGGLKYYACHWHAYTYHPLSTYSHMLDCQLFGLSAGGHHAMNIALHAITAVLLFLLVRQMTGHLWPAALVAALFAIHPLRVQSVAWISERKDVLSGLFFVLTLAAYVRYVRGPQTAGRYAVVCLLYVLGLLAKPMLVTLPLVLLLLDYWPLRRWPAAAGEEEGELQPAHGHDEVGDAGGMERAMVDAGEAPAPQADAGETPAPQADAGETPARRSAWRFPWCLVIEKIPLLLLAAADSALTVRTQVDAIQSLESISLLARIANTAVAYVSYLGCFFWPRGLAVLYPHPSDGFSVRMVFGTAAILAIVSAGVFLARWQAPYLLVGWLWYLGMLVPVIGLLQVGGQSMADRYTYLPQIGLLLGLVWAVTDLRDLLAARVWAVMWRAARFLGALAAAGIIAALAVAAWQETGYWRDSETLWGRDMLYPNLVAYYNLGLALATEHRHEEAIEQFEKGCAISATDEDTLDSYAQSLEALGRVADAVTKYRAALAVNEKSVRANNGLALILLGQGKDREALACWRHALKEEPKNLAIGTQIAGLLAASPDAAVRDGKEAVLVAEKMVELSKGKDPAALDALAAARAETGDFAAAIANAQTALELAAAGGEDKLAGEIKAHLTQYQAGKPYRRSPKIEPLGPKPEPREP